MPAIQPAPHKVDKYDILNPVARTEKRIVVEDSPRRVRAVFNGETIADSTNMKLMHETRHLPVYYFPIEEVRLDLMQKTDHSTHCPHKGDASYWSVQVGDKLAENAMWTYENPIDKVPEIKGLVAFYWNKMNHWYEEDEEIFIHARDPYKRIDTIASTRHVQVMLGGETIADSKRPYLLFETGLPVRYYLPKEDVRLDLLAPSDLLTGCPYKGTASYYSATVNGKQFDNIVWTYPDPVSDCPKIRDLLCFYNENVDQIIVDGEVVEKPKTKWSV